jgi:hypothetical protein
MNRAKDRRGFSKAVVLCEGRAQSITCKTTL